MKTSIIFADGLTQINFTPETDNEKMALRLITADQQLEVAVQNGSFMDKHQQKPFTASINKCRGGYLRTFTDQESKMIVLKPRDPEPVERPEIDVTENEVFQPVNKKTLEPLNISRNADECLRMLNHWDDHQIFGDCGGIIHKRAGDSNTMRVVKSFLQSLIDNFPKQ